MSSINGKIEEPIKLLNEIWQFIHNKLNEDISNNRNESAKSMGEVASFIRKKASSHLLNEFNTGEFYK